MKLQVAFDYVDIEGAKRILEEIYDIIEIGTPFVIREGIRAISEIKNDYGDIEVLEDLKIMDSKGNNSAVMFCKHTNLE